MVGRYGSCAVFAILKCDGCWITEMTAKDKSSWTNVSLTIETRGTFQVNTSQWSVFKNFLMKAHTRTHTHSHIYTHTPPSSLVTFYTVSECFTQPTTSWQTATTSASFEKLLTLELGRERKETSILPEDFGSEHPGRGAEPGPLAGPAESCLQVGRADTAGHKIPDGANCTPERSRAGWALTVLSPLLSLAGGQAVEPQMVRDAHQLL